MGLQGGEVMLYPEYCIEINNLWRKYNKYGHTHMITNGFCGNDKNLMSIMYQKIKPDLIMLSVDKWHQEHINILNINNIIRELENHPDINLGAFQIFSKNYHNVSTEQKKLGIVCNKTLPIISLPMKDYGRARILVESGEEELPVYRQYDQEEVKCENFGFSLHPDESVVANCSLERNGCKFGKIDEVDFIELFKLNKNRPKIIYTGKIQCFSYICKTSILKPIEKEWKLRKVRNEINNK